jgi:hypothetical protein
MLRQTSLGKLGLGVGGVLSVVGFAAYFLNNPTLNLVGFFYGIPLLLGGLALRAAELKPVPFTQSTSSDVLKLREEQATPTQTQIRKDITRYRYGQKAHFESALSYLGLSPTDEERPLLIGLREEAVDGAYALVLEFDSPLIPLDTWQKKLEKMTGFFAPGVRVVVTQPQEKRIDLTLISTPKS